jgi:AhpC/TSA family
MKRSVLLFLLVTTVLVSHSQTDLTQPPYLRFPGFPAVKLLLPDSSSYFTKEKLNKKTAVMLMIFNPQCEHCQHETGEIIKHMDEFKHIQIVMATVMPFDSMLAFRERYKLARYRNIVVGQDQHFFLPPYYKISSLPFLAFYNRKKELISVFEGTMPIEKALNELKK